MSCPSAFRIWGWPAKYERASGGGRGGAAEHGGGGAEARRAAGAHAAGGAIARGAGGVAARGDARDADASARRAIDRIARRARGGGRADASARGRERARGGVDVEPRNETKWSKKLPRSNCRDVEPTTFFRRVFRRPSRSRTARRAPAARHVVAPPAPARRARLRPLGRRAAGGGFGQRRRDASRARRPAMATPVSRRSAPPRRVRGVARPPGRDPPGGVRRPVRGTRGKTRGARATETPPPAPATIERATRRRALASRLPVPKYSRRHLIPRRLVRRGTHATTRLFSFASA